MTRNEKIFAWSFVPGSIYFLLVSVVHMAQVKVPVLFVYFDVPSHAYQDRIISLLAFGWALFFYLAFKMVKWGKSLWTVLQITSGAYGIMAFTLINSSGELTEKLEMATTLPYWIATAGLAVYLVWLMVWFYLAVKK